MPHASTHSHLPPFISIWTLVPLPLWISSLLPPFPRKPSCFPLFTPSSAIHSLALPTWHMTLGLALPTWHMTLGLTSLNSTALLGTFTLLDSFKATGGVACGSSYPHRCPSALRDSYPPASLAYGRYINKERGVGGEAPSCKVGRPMAEI